MRGMKYTNSKNNIRIFGTMQNLWYLTDSYEAEVVTFSFFVRGTICDIWILVLCRICDIWPFRTMQNLWYLTCSYEAEVVTFSFFVRGTICDIFLLRTRRKVVLFWLHTKLGRLGLYQARRKSTDFICLFKSKGKYIYIIIFHIHQQYLYTLLISKFNILSKS
jgi:hypothetical protein